MFVTNVNELELEENWSKSDPAARMKVTMPVFAGAGAEDCAVVWMVLEPGGSVATHTDSAEEVVLVLEGTLEGWVGDERGTLEEGSLVVIPALAPHGLRNTGMTTARAIGFFAEGTVEHVFEEPLMPYDERVLQTPPPPEEAE
jgi:quercetin dioxygenase-like cupin family protein